MKRTCVSFNSSLLVCVLFLLLSLAARAQIFITYPTPAQGLTRQLDSSLLTVNVAFAAACNNAAVNIRFPAGVNYIPGSVAKTGGSASVGITATGSSLSSPTFSITGVTGVSDITFTIRRKALCNAPAGSKDTVMVTGDCGTQTENTGTVNSYAIISPSLTMPAVAPLNNAVNSAMITRTLSVINGGNGCLDTLYFFIRYPSSGMQLQSLTANGNTITSYRSNGDTLFFKASGAELSANGGLCNGGTVAFTETATIKRCNTTTTFGARWGHADDATACQTVTATGTMNMAPITVSTNVTFNASQEMATCGQSVFDLTYVNGNTANDTTPGGRIFNVIPTYTLGGAEGIDSIRLYMGAATMSNAIPYTQSGSTYQIPMSFLSADPDGPGGLQDLDGDGQYDDLVRGGSFRLRYYMHFGCGANMLARPQSRLNYTDNCGTLKQGQGSIGDTGFPDMIYGSTFNPRSRNALYPTVISPGAPFTIVVNQSMQSNWLPFPAPTNTSYFSLLLPPGLSLSGTGNITRNGGAVPAGQVSVHAAAVPLAPDTLVVVAGTGFTAGNFSIDLVNNGAATTITSGSSNDYVADNSCNCKITGLPLQLYNIAVVQPPGCPDMIANNGALFARKTFGYTNNTMTTRVAAAAVTGLAAITVAQSDSFTLSQGGVNHGSRSNAYYNFQVRKENSANLVTYGRGIFYIRNGLGQISSCVMPAPADSSTAMLQRLVWNLSGCLPPGGLAEGDSVWTEVYYRLEEARSSTRTAVDSTASYFFSRSGGAQDTLQICNRSPFYFYAVKPVLTSNFNAGFATAPVCGAVPGSPAFGYGFAEGDLYPGEFRPSVIIDSMRTTLPAYYNFGSPMPLNYTAAGALTVNVATTVAGNMIRATNPGPGNPGYWAPADIGDQSAQGSYGRIANFLIRASSQGAGQAGQNMTVTYYVRRNAYADQPVTDVIAQNVFIHLTQQPQLSVTNLSGNVQVIQQQSSWDISVSNTGPNASPNTWLQLNPAAGTGIVVDSVCPLTGSVAGMALSQLGYSQGTWYQLPNVPASQAQQYRVFFHATNCQPGTLVARAGWKCDGYYPDPSQATWTLPATNLTFSLQPSQVQFSIGSQPTQPIPMCSTDSVVLDMNSAQAANITSPAIKVTAPQGMTLTVPFEVEYPFNSGNWQGINPVLAGGSYSIDLSQHTGMGINGLPGTLSNPDAEDRQARLKVRFTTDCSFASGSQLAFVLHGQRPCGEPAPGDGVSLRSNPVHILGAPPVVSSAATQIDIAAPSIGCSSGTTVDLTITPVGAPLGVDTAVYQLPKGIQYAGSFTPGANCTGCVLAEEVRSDGLTYLSVGLPVGSPANTPIQFSYTIATDGATCGSDSIACTVERSVIPPPDLWHSNLQ
ncbi:hypothetical protein [Taibaiella koreensis]|uniref:hypothetical protein n=1 Tax=Taibaiella koreensis TaxID=1268548 RepID=UPI000E599A5D|nr:hypothetical protein [Taibaiella koreensis]